MIKEYCKTSKDQLSDSFNISEFHCHCNDPHCTITYVDTDLLDKLQSKRDEWNKPIHINCGFRCTSHNKSVGGKPGSMHLLGKAADIVVPGWSVEEMAEHCEDFGGLGRYPAHGFIHCDVRPNYSRWVG